MSFVVRRSRVASAVVAVVFGCLAACGGGTDIAPSQPVVTGNGSGTARLGANDLGATSQVRAVVASVQSAPATAVDEVVSFDAAGLAVLLHGQVSTAGFTLTGPGGVPVYGNQGSNSTCVTDVPPCDFWIEDPVAGLIQARLGGPVPLAPATLLADYTYNERLLSYNVSLIYANGQSVVVTLYHLPSRPVPPVTITQEASSPPLAPYALAFNVVVQTNLTTSDQRVTYQAVGDPSNLVTLTRVDLANESDPCLAGDVTALVQSLSGSEQLPLDASFETPGC